MARTSQLDAGVDRRLRTPRLLARFAAHRRGATAVEFALVLFPFLFLIFSILELAMVFLVGVTLENATAVAARQLRTEQVFADGVTDTNGVNAFKSTICANMGWIPSSTCRNQLQVDVRAYSSFESQTQPNPLSSGTFNTANLCFYSGNPSGGSSATNTIVLVRAYYMWPLITQYLNGGLMNVTKVTNGTVTLQTGHYTAVEAAEVFKNEPASTSNPATGTC